MLSKILDTICYEAKDIIGIARRRSYLLKVNNEPMTYRQFLYLNHWQENYDESPVTHPYSDFSEEDTLVLNKEMLFGAENFKLICGVDLPDDIARFYAKYQSLGSISYPVVADFDYEEFRNSDRKDLMCPEKIAKVYMNQWDSSVNFYTKRGHYDFKRRRLLPIIQMDDGCFIKYSFAKTKPSGIYFGDKKIANNMEELVLRLCINPNYMIPLKYRSLKKYMFSDFTAQSEIPWEYLKQRYG